MMLSTEEMINVRLLCAKYEIIFSRSLNHMGFCDKHSQKELKMNALQFRRKEGSMSLEIRKSMEKIVENLEQDALVEPTHSD